MAKVEAHMQTQFGLVAVAAEPSSETGTPRASTAAAPTTYQVLWLSKAHGVQHGSA